MASVVPCFCLQSDGAKIICSVATLQAPCVIYSLGSNGDVSFEQDIIKQTPCEVHTFDCTVASISIVDSQRHIFHKLCIGKSKGNPTPQGPQFDQLNSVMKKLGHTKLALLKMDIEGSEFEVSLTASERSVACL
jgi:hypothetical protein